MWHLNNQTSQSWSSLDQKQVFFKSKSKDFDENLNTDILEVWGREWIELDTLVFLLTARLALESLSGRPKKFVCLFLENSFLNWEQFSQVFASMQTHGI